ncbi:hypothetical protein THAOC_12873 [Thalassiosira oceanica]|uniref:BZIP domain-containing protein n=1 Tax=Thalassiosira oceanica TaxID=159749 RepID=K0SJ52_THAOC|nr:hypothetical protein THAOC_12873 [Thalassiosira oceanica]|eukprot:EJK66223.1 hypothetical protein THAOC_12873 [Thalassiosira oceanica]
MAGTRKRAIKTEAEEAAGNNWTMQESVDALAGVSASLSTAGDKRKSSSPSNGANKRSKKGANGMTARDRSSSIEGLVGAAASLEEGGDPTALPVPVDVPNPMLAPPVVDAVAAVATSSPPKTAPAKHHPTGFRKAKSGSSGAKKGKPKAQPKATAASGLAAAKKTKAAASKNLGLLGSNLDDGVPVGLVGGTKITTTTGGAKRQQVQYNPDRAMTKEQLTQWRREMRRVRNRESAAASRKKVRDRIEDLEREVNKWRVRYGDVINRIGDAERQRMGLPDADQVDAEDHDLAMQYDDEGAAQGDTLHPSAAPAPKQAKAKRKKLPTNKVKKEESQPMDGDDVLQREGGEVISHQV